MPRPARRTDDETVAVPLGIAAAQANPVHHAVPEEPVVLRRVGHRLGVRAVAQPATLEFGRDLPGRRQVERGDLLGRRVRGCRRGTGSRSVADRQSPVAAAGSSVSVIELHPTRMRAHPSTEARRVGVVASPGRTRAEAGPGEGRDFGGDLIGVEVVAQFDQPAAGAFGHADERVRDRACGRLRDVDGDQRCAWPWLPRR